MLKRNINSPRTSSMGRLFDAVASILDLCQVSTFEGQAAMAVEFEAMKARNVQSYPFNFEAAQIDWRPLMLRMVDDLVNNIPTAEIAAKFHNTLAEMIVTVAQAVSEGNILLTGGCFQNRLLTDKAFWRLRESGFTPNWHHHIPPNDGGIAIGQIAALQHHITCNCRGAMDCVPSEGKRTASACV
jgi:hydrogenase maturation protein HypF